MAEKPAQKKPSYHLQAPTQAGIVFANWPQALKSADFDSFMQESGLGQFFSQDQYKECVFNRATPDATMGEAVAILADVHKIAPYAIFSLLLEQARERLLKEQVIQFKSGAPEKLLAAVPPEQREAITSLTATSIAKAGYIVAGLQPNTIGERSNRKLTNAKVTKVVAGDPVAITKAEAEAMADLFKLEGKRRTIFLDGMKKNIARAATGDTVPMPEKDNKKPVTPTPKTGKPEAPVIVGTALGKMLEDMRKDEAIGIFAAKVGAKDVTQYRQVCNNHYESLPPKISRCIAELTGKTESEINALNRRLIPTYASGEDIPSPSVKPVAKEPAPVTTTLAGAAAAAEELDPVNMLGDALENKRRRLGMGVNKFAEKKLASPREPYVRLVTTHDEVPDWLMQYAADTLSISKQRARTLHGEFISMTAKVIGKPPTPPAQGEGQGL